MTRQEILKFVVQHAKRNGFDFRAWYRAAMDADWESLDAAIETLAHGRRYYALLFSQEFAECFWKAGSQISFMVPAVSYTVRDKAGKVVTIHRKPFTRRTLKADFWHYHLREMADSPHPLRYIRRFIVLQEDLHAAVAQPADEREDDSSQRSDSAKNGRHPPLH